jgi:hypothetical protein
MCDLCGKSYLTVEVSYEGSRRDASTNPSSSSIFGDKILRVLNVLGEVRDEGDKLAIEEGLGDGPTGSLDARELRVDQTAFHIGIETTATHVGNGGEGAGLEVKGAALATLLDLIGTKTRVLIDLLVVVAVAFASQQSGVGNLHTHGLLLGGCEVGDKIIAGSRGIAELLEHLTAIIAHTCKGVDDKVAGMDAVAWTRKGSNRC